MQNDNAQKTGDGMIASEKDDKDINYKDLEDLEQDPLGETTVLPASRYTQTFNWVCPKPHTFMITDVQSRTCVKHLNEICQILLLCVGVGQYFRSS